MNIKRNIVNNETRYVIMLCAYTYYNYINYFLLQTYSGLDKVKINYGFL